MNDGRIIEGEWINGKQKVQIAVQEAGKEEQMAEEVDEKPGLIEMIKEEVKEKVNAL